MADNIFTSPGPKRPKNWLGIACGAVVLAMVMLMYLITRTYTNGVPAGHPWSGIMWMMIGYMTLRSALKGAVLPPIVYWVTLGLAVVGVVIWSGATFGWLPN